MKRIFVTVISAVAILAMTTALMGCTGSTDAELAESDAIQQFGEGAFTKMGDNVEPVKEGEMPDSHQMMAMMILEGAGKNSDLSSYDQVTLVPVWLPDGREINAVVLDESETVFPATATEGQ